jgi:hypothetical protein
MVRLGEFIDCVLDVFESGRGKSPCALSDGGLLGAKSKIDCHPDLLTKIVVPGERERLFHNSLKLSPIPQLFKAKGNLLLEFFAT